MGGGGWSGGGRCRNLLAGRGYMVFMGDGGDISRRQQSIKGEDRVKRG